MRGRGWSVLSLLAVVWFMPSVAWAQKSEEAAKKEADRIAKWQPQIAAFEKQDAAKPPAQGGIVFVGSSTIRLWDLAKSFPKHNAINRGFGGSHLADTRKYLPRLVLKHKPQVVVIYAGGNDLASGKSPAEAFADFQAIHQALRADLPECRLVFLGLRPTLKRLELRAKEKELNDKVRTYLADKPRATFLESDKPFCDKAGQPRADLLRDDKLHLNEAGYVILSQLLRPVLLAATGKKAAQVEPPPEFQKREYKSASGETLKYVVYVPKKLSADKPVPFLVFLHGSSAECVTHERILRESNLQLWHGYGRNVQREPTILMAPVGGQGGWTSEARQQAVFGLIDALVKEFPIDRRRMYLQGFSMGDLERPGGVPGSSRRPTRKRWAVGSWTSRKSSILQSGRPSAATTAVSIR